MRLSSCASDPATLRCRYRSGNPIAAATERLVTPWARGMIPFIFLHLLLATFLLDDATSAKQNAARDSGVRSCGVPPQEAATATKPAKRKKNSGTRAQADDASTCLEVHASALEVQEHLQKLVREQRWPIGDEDVHETLWSFNLDLSKEELLSYAKPELTTEHVNWQGGKAVVLVTTVDLSNGYARTTVSAQFKGFGESEDTFATKRAFWTLTSNGKLEARLTEALKTRFRANP
jgi:hypothetical protein